MTETIWIALIGAVAALATPWMNALAKRWLESGKGKRASTRQNVNQQAATKQRTTSGERAMAKVLTMPFYALAIWSFLIALSMFGDRELFKGVGFLIIATIFVVAAHYMSEWIVGPSQSN